MKGKSFIIEEIVGEDALANNKVILDILGYRPENEYVFYIDIEIQLQHIENPSWSREILHIAFASPAGYIEKHGKFTDIRIPFICFLNQYNGKSFIKYIEDIIYKEQTYSSLETIIKLSRFFIIENIDRAPTNLEYLLKKIKKEDFINKKHIHFVSPTDNEYILDPSFEFLSILILHVGEDYWNKGTDSAYIYYKEDLPSGLEIMFNKDLDGFYLQYSGADGLYHSHTDKLEDKFVSINLNGVLEKLSSRFFISRQQTILVIKHFLETGNRLDMNLWIEDK